MYAPVKKTSCRHVCTANGLALVMMPRYVQWRGINDPLVVVVVVVVVVFVYIVDLLTDEVTIILSLYITLSFGSLTAVCRLIFYHW